MKSKSGIILKTLIEKLKNNAHFFGNIASAETYGTNVACADVAMEKDGKTEVYKIIVIKER